MGWSWLLRFLQKNTWASKRNAPFLPHLSPLPSVSNRCFLEPPCGKPLPRHCTFYGKYIRGLVPCPFGANGLAGQTESRDY